MLRRTLHTILGLAIGALSAAAPAAALTIGPGQGIEAPFSLTAPATGANTLTFNLVSVSAVGVTTMTVELYDGATLLGSVSGVSVNGIAAFVDVGSLWTTNAVSTDLASVRAGTIVGRIVVLPDFGAVGRAHRAGLARHLVRGRQRHGRRDHPAHRRRAERGRGVRGAGAERGAAPARRCGRSAHAPPAPLIREFPRNYGRLREALHAGVRPRPAANR